MLARCLRLDGRYQPGLPCCTPRVIRMSFAGVLTRGHSAGIHRLGYMHLDTLSLPRLRRPIPAFLAQAARRTFLRTLQAPTPSSRCATVTKRISTTNSNICIPATPATTARCPAHTAQRAYRPRTTHLAARPQTSSILPQARGSTSASTRSSNNASPSISPSHPRTIGPQSPRANTTTGAYLSSSNLSCTIFPSARPSVASVFPASVAAAAFCLDAVYFGCFIGLACLTCDCLFLLPPGTKKTRKTGLTTARSRR